MLLSFSYTILACIGQIFALLPTHPISPSLYYHHLYSSSRVSLLLEDPPPLSLSLLIWLGRTPHLHLQPFLSLALKVPSMATATRHKATTPISFLSLRKPKHFPPLCFEFRPWRPPPSTTAVGPATIFNHQTSGSKASFPDLGLDLLKSNFKALSF